MILATTILSSGVCAQNDIDAPLIRAESRWTGSAYLDWGIASGHFATNLDHDEGLGLGGEFLYRLQKGGPVWGGVGVHSFIFDRYNLLYSQELDGEIYNYQDRTASRLFMAHGLIRFQPKIRYPIRPYLQGAIGMHWFFTNTTIKDTDLNESIDRLSENRASVIGFAVHAGFHVVPPRFPDFRAEFRFGYFRNASVEYMRYNEDLGGPFAVDAFERKESAVDLIGIHIGVAIRIREEY
jgi:hypothetical protein